MKKERVQTPYIELSKVNRFFGITKALEQIDFQIFSGEVIGLVGPNGAGKSTLLNQISPELNLATGEISDALGRGRHTTRHVELLPIYGGLVADTPGFSSIDFLTIEAGELPRQFPEFVEASAHCKFRECMHAKEPGCEVKHRVETGGIAQTRYDNYLQFLQEIEKRKPMYTKKEGKRK